jgi:uncharacterized LabA/DUF88 family protein
MDREQIKKFIQSFQDKLERTIVIVDFGNVEKWKESLGWIIGIKELGKLTKSFSGKVPLRKFYYGGDYGPNEKSAILSGWSKRILELAEWYRFDIVTKPVKYIHDSNNRNGYQKKCDFDVEMTVDLIKERDNYDTIILFSGDGDLMCAIKYLNEIHLKKCFVFGARDHVGREIFDAKSTRVVEDILYAEDFEYRLNMRRFWS